MKASVIKITPEIARQLLAQNPHNRPINKMNLDMICRDLKQGKWMENGESIIVDWDGNLLDGQHRLMAVVNTGICFNSVFAEGIHPRAFATIDQGRKRTAAEILQLLGEVNTTNLVSALGIIDCYQNKRYSFSQPGFSHEEVIALLDKNPKIRQSMALPGLRCNLAPPALLAALHYLFAQKDPEAAGEFIVKLTTGVNLDQADPVLLLRQRLLKNAQGTAKINRSYAAALIIKAWNASRCGIVISNLRLRKGPEGKNAEQFPVIV